MSNNPLRADYDGSPASTPRETKPAGPRTGRVIIFGLIVLFGFVACSGANSRSTYTPSRVSSSPSTATASNEELDTLALQMVWDNYSPAERVAFCNAYDTLGRNAAAHTLSDGSGGSISFAAAARFMVAKCN